MLLSESQLKRLERFIKSGELSSKHADVLLTLIESQGQLRALLSDPAATQDDLDRYVAKYFSSRSTLIDAFPAAPSSNQIRSDSQDQGT